MKPATTDGADNEDTEHSSYIENDGGGGSLSNRALIELLPAVMDKGKYQK